MVVQSVLDKVRESLGSLRIQLPEGTRLLFEILAAPDEDLMVK